MIDREFIEQILEFLEVEREKTESLHNGLVETIEHIKRLQKKFFPKKEKRK